VFDYYLADKPEGELELEILDSDGNVVRSFESGKKDGEAMSEMESFFGGGGDKPLPAAAGMHRFTWNTRYEGVDKVKDAILWGFTGGPRALPGTYTARLSAGDWTVERSFQIRPDPRWKNVTHQDLVDQLHMAMAIRDTLTRVYDGIRDLRSAREQIHAAVKRAKDAGAEGDIEARADSLVSHMDALEGELMQTRNESGQDPIRFTPQFDNQVAALYQNVAFPDGVPTQGAKERWQDLLSRWTSLRQRLDTLLKRDVGSFNEMLQGRGVPAVAVPKHEGGGA